MIVYVKSCNDGIHKYQGYHDVKYMEISNIDNKTDVTLFFQENDFIVVENMEIIIVE